MKDFQIKLEQALSRYQAINAKLILSEAQISSLASLSAELKQPAAVESIRQDPYWPKWNSPWWKVLLLYEAGYKQLIPTEFLATLLDVMDAHYLHTFPLTEAELPENCDPYRDIMCFCALGNMYKVLEDCGFDVRSRLPWAYEWLSKYQLPDGGYNCDEAAYTRSCKSSFLSTLPMLEAMLIVYRKTRDAQLKILLDKGAQYLLNHSIYKSSQGKIIDQEWLLPSFPRYYDYDVLRGFAFIVDWAEETQSSLPLTLAEDCYNQVSQSLNEDGYIIPGLNKLSREGSLFYDNQTCSWNWNAKSDSFPALDDFNQTNAVSIPLTQQWMKTLSRLSQLTLS